MRRRRCSRARPGKQLVRHRQAREHHERWLALARELLGKFLRPAGVDESPTCCAHGAHDRRVAVTGRDSQHGAARGDQHLHRHVDRRREPVRKQDVVAAGNAAQVLERELLEPPPVNGGCELVVEERRVGLAERQRPLEAREVVEPAGPMMLLHQLPRPPELAVVVRRAAEDPAPGVRHAFGLRR